MKIIKLLMPIIATSLLFSCSKPGGGTSTGNETENKAPVINWILSDVIDYHESLLTLNGIEAAQLYNLAHLLTISVSDPDGHDDIIDIRYTHESDGTYIIKSSESNPYWIADYEFYQSPGISPFNKDTIQLNNWTMTVTDSAGNTTTKDFGFVLPNLAEPASNETFLYSSNKYSTAQAGGVSTLKSPNITTITRDTPNTTVTVSFDSLDERTKTVHLTFLDDTGAEVAESAEITGTELETVKTNGELIATNNSGIVYSDGKSFGDITKLFWVSIDDDSQTSINNQPIPGWWRNKTLGEVKSF